LAGILDATAYVISTTRGLTGKTTTLDEVWIFAQESVCFGSSINQLDQDFVASANTIVVDCTSNWLADASSNSTTFFSRLGKR